MHLYRTMNALLWFASALLLFGLVGTLMLARRKTRDGYEDELGFHYGPEPRQR